MPAENRISFVMQELVRRTEELTRRLSEVEQSLNALEQRFSVIEEMQIKRARKYEDKFASMEKTINEISNKLTKLELNVNKINKQMDKFARQSELKELETLVNVITPKKSVNA